MYSNNCVSDLFSGIMYFDFKVTWDVKNNENDYRRLVWFNNDYFKFIEYSKRVWLIINLYVLNKTINCSTFSIFLRKTYLKK